jgi:hypothetical protein
VFDRVASTNSPRASNARGRCALPGSATQVPRGLAEISGPPAVLGILALSDPSKTGRFSSFAGLLRGIELSEATAPWMLLDGAADVCCASMARSTADTLALSIAAKTASVPKMAKVHFHQKGSNFWRPAQTEIPAVAE